MLNLGNPVNPCKANKRLGNFSNTVIFFLRRITFASVCIDHFPNIFIFFHCVQLQIFLIIRDTNPIITPIQIIFETVLIKYKDIGKSVFTKSRFIVSVHACVNATIFIVFIKPNLNTWHSLICTSDIPIKGLCKNISFIIDLANFCMTLSLLLVMYPLHKHPQTLFSFVTPLWMSVKLINCFSKSYFVNSPRLLK